MKSLRWLLTSFTMCLSLLLMSVLVLSLINQQQQLPLVVMSPSLRSRWKRNRYNNRYISSSSEHEDEDSEIKSIAHSEQNPNDHQQENNYFRTLPSEMISIANHNQVEEKIAIHKSVKPAINSEITDRSQPISSRVGEFIKLFILKRINCFKSI